MKTNELNNFIEDAIRIGDFTDLEVKDDDHIDYNNDIGDNWLEGSVWIDYADLAYIHVKFFKKVTVEKPARKFDDTGWEFYNDYIVILDNINILINGYRMFDEGELEEKLDSKVIGKLLDKIEDEVI